MYERPPSLAEIKAAGLTPQDFDNSPFEVWPDSWVAFQLFHQMQTQWRAGSGGPTGLDYNVLFRKMDRMGLSADAYDELEGDIRVMELEALSTMHEKG